MVCSQSHPDQFLSLWPLANFVLLQFDKLMRLCMENEETGPWFCKRLSDCNLISFFF